MNPTALPVNADGIPTALKHADRWVLWKYVWQTHERTGAGRWTKIPCQITGRYARPNDSSTWTSFEDALDAYRTGHPVAGNWNDILKLPFDGLGFCLGDGWAGIDYDKTDVRPDTLAYVETSPSGRGFKVFGRSARRGGEINFDTQQKVPFSASRFFAVTGHGHGDPLVDLTPVIDVWFPQAINFVSPFGPVPSFIRPGDTRGTENIDDRPLYPKLDDAALVAAIKCSAQAAKFLKLANGDMSDYGDDHSRADQALINILAYWSQGDADQIDRLFRKSALMRDKWLSRSYCHATLLKAGLAEAQVRECLRRR